MSLPRVQIITDGSGTASIPNGGWCAVIRYAHSGGVTEKIITGHIPGQISNIKCEMAAAINGLNSLTRACDVVLISDLQMLVKGINIWLDGWSRNNWRSKAGKRVENPDLWRQIHVLTKIHNVKAEWVRGHSGNKYNEICDELAGKARMGELTNTVKFIEGAQL